MAAPKIVLATVGSWGDLHPFLAIGQALRTRGARPVLAVPLDHVPKCRAAGLEAEPFLPSYAELGKATGLDNDDIVQRVISDPNFLVSELLLPPLSESVDRLLDITAGASAIAGSQLAFAAPIAAGVHAVPYIAALLQPMAWFSRLDPPTSPQLRAFAKPPLGILGRNWNRLIGEIVAAVMTRRYAKRIDAVRIAHGLPKSAAVPILQPSTTPAYSLGLYSPALADLPPDAPRPAALTGFPWFDSADGKPPALDPQLSSFLKEGPPPLVVSLGSFIPAATQDFYRRAAETALALKMRAVLLTQADLGITAPAVITTGYAPHSLLFPHAAAILHHGGIGTTGQALRSGKPQLIVPFMGDQFDQAHRLEKLGAGLCASPDEFMKDGAALLRALLDDPQHGKAAARIALHVRAENGADAAAAKILQTAGR